ncbi:MAG: N-acetyltransferase [Proteobacteria bacterium]|nr:MAG: N-acetyltransferase [Pseudomonadota bacterium]
MIVGSRTVLRAIEAVDAIQYHAWINDAETNHLRGLHHPMSMTAAEQWIEAQKSPTAAHISLAIQVPGGESIGFVGLRNICNRSRRAEIWIYIGNKKFWRKGNGSDAMAALITYAFHDMNLHRIWLDMDPGYPGTVKMYEKLGFVHEGTLRKDHYRHGEYRDAAIYGLLKEEWQKAQQ